MQQKKIYRNIKKSFLSPFLVILAVILLPSTGKALWFLPLIFAFAVSIVNREKIIVKSKPFGIIISILQSYGVFIGMSIVVYLLDSFMPEVYVAENQFDIKGIALVTFGGYLAALLLFYFYTFSFRVKNKRIAYFVISVCYVLIVIVMQIFSKNEFLQFGVEKFTSFLISWLIFMSLAYSLSMNFHAFEAYFSKKK
ncbi:MAG: hypothetical protein PHO74_04515 [Weeksellaceae bacterium]|nr:hypothetical protein [Weeksellaceae bacterium]